MASTVIISLDHIGPLDALPERFRDCRSASLAAEDDSTSPRRVVNELLCDLGHIPALHLTTVRSVEDPLTWRARVAAEHNVYAACPAHRRRPGW